MTPEERAGMASAITEAIALACAAVREEHASALALVRCEAADALEVMRSAQRAAEQRADQLERDLVAVRELAAQPAISALMVDAVGDLHVVQRNGATSTASLTQLVQRIAQEVGDRIETLGADLRGEAAAQVAREVLRMGGAQRWSRTAIYGEGAVVSIYNGRTYELAPGVRASMAQEPGDHPEVWHRIGSHGLRVLKSKPARVEPGDVFAENESRFISDGEAVTLLVPRAPKQSDIDRTFKAAHSLAQSAMDHATHAERLAQGHEPRLEAVERDAANSLTWIAEEGDAAVLRSATTERWVEERAEEIDTVLEQQREDDAA